MTDAYIYDHVRSPRGRGRSNGALHEVTPVNLAAQILSSLRDRNVLDTNLVDDVVFGCVSPVGEQGSVIPRAALLMADYDQSVPAKQLNRFCASGLEAVNTAAAQIMAGQSDVAIGGGIECMSRVPMGSDSGAMHADPAVAYKTYFAPQGIGADLIASLHGFSRQDVDAYAVESQKRAANAWEKGWFSRSVVPVRDVIGQTLLERDEHLRPGWTDAVRDLSQLLRQGESIYQMMQVTGEEGITLSDYVTYQKSLLLDMVYLQQDAYDQVDVSVPLDRQREVFALVHGLMQRDYPFLEPRESEHFFRNYGLEAWDVLGKATTRADLGRDYGGGLTEAEVDWLRRKEWARRADDIVWRRTKRGLRMTAEEIAALAASLAG